MPGHESPALPAAATIRHCRVRRRAGRPTAGWAPTRATPTTPAATPRPRASVTDPVTGQPVGTALGEGLRRRSRHADRGRAGRAPAGPAAGAGRRLPGADREDEMVAAFDYCLHGKGGAAPSIDTAMHGLVDAAHVDHLHPDAGIALADGRRRREADARTASATGSRGCPGAGPASSSASTSPRSSAANPQAIGCILGGHGITAWGETSEECESRSLEIIAHRQRFIDEHRPPRAVRPGAARIRAAASAGAPGPRRRPGAGAARPGLHRPPAGRPLHDSPAVLDFLARSEHPRLAGWAPPAPTTSCAPRSARWCWTCRRRAGLDAAAGRLRELHDAVPGGLPGLLRPARHRGQPGRSAARTRPSCWSPASACSASARTSRPPGWPASSTSTRST